MPSAVCGKYASTSEDFQEGLERHLQHRPTR